MMHSDTEEVLEIAHHILDAARVAGLEVSLSLGGAGPQLMIFGVELPSQFKATFQAQCNVFQAILDAKLAQQPVNSLATRNTAKIEGATLAWDEVIVFEFGGGLKKRIGLYQSEQVKVDRLFEGLFR
jgi:hypothetical protein